jgi:peptidoglycan/LPS O-acetylase OafA/YrhL
VSWSRRLLAFALAVLAAAIWGALWQTQSNLADLQALGAQVPFALRLRTTLQDLLGFGPLWGAVSALAFAFAFPLGSLLARRGAPPLWFALAGWSALVFAVRLADAATPPPVLIAATRGTLGLFGMTAGGALAGLLYAWLRRPARR